MLNGYLNNKKIIYFNDAPIAETNSHYSRERENYWQIEYVFTNMNTGISVNLFTNERLKILENKKILTTKKLNDAIPLQIRA